MPQPIVGQEETVERLFKAGTRACATGLVSAFL